MWGVLLGVTNLASCKCYIPASLRRRSKKALPIGKSPRNELWNINRFQIHRILIKFCSVLDIARDNTAGKQ